MMDFESLETAMYGNVDDDDELNAELMALQEEEDRPAKRSSPAPKQQTRVPVSVPQKQRRSTDFDQIDALARRISVEANVTDDEADGSVETDADLLNELDGLVGDDSSVPPVPVRQQPLKPSTTVDVAVVSLLSSRLTSYRNAEQQASQSGNSSKAKRLERGVRTLESLLQKAKKGGVVDEGEVPVELPSVVPTASSAGMPPAAHAPLPPPVAPRKPKLPPMPTLPVTDDMPSPVTPSGSGPSPSGAAPHPIRTVLVRRRDAYKRNAALAKRAADRSSAVESYKMAKNFDEAIAAVDRGEVTDDFDMREVPPTPPPYAQQSDQSGTNSTVKKPVSIPTGPPRTLMEGLEQRYVKYKDAAERAQEEGNDRKYRQNMRIVQQYADAIKAHKAGRPVDVQELPNPPGYHPLPTTNITHSAAVSSGQHPRPSSHPAAAVPTRSQPVGPYGPVISAADDGASPPKQSRQDQQLDFLQNRQLQFRQAALLAKRKGDMELAKKYLISAKGYEKMIAASEAGLPVDIKNAPLPPQTQTNKAFIQPSIDSKEIAQSSSVIEGTPEEVYATLERDLIRQVQICDQNREYFTKVGDVGHVNKYEQMAVGLKRDLVTLRQAAKRRDPLPRFRYEMKAFPSLDVCPDLGEDDVELGIVRILHANLPAGYEEKHADIFVKYEFPFPQEAPQTGRTKSVTGTASPAFMEKFKLKINRKSRQLTRLTKRHGVKFEVYQKGGFLRSDKLIGVCECKLLPLETKAHVHDSMDLMEGRKPIGGKLEAKLRIREPLVEKRATVVREKWLVIDEFSRVVVQKPQNNHQQQHLKHQTRVAGSSSSHKPPIALPILSTKVVNNKSPVAAGERVSVNVSGPSIRTRYSDDATADDSAKNTFNERRSSADPPRGLRRTNMTDV